MTQPDHPMTYTVEEAQRYNGQLLEAKTKSKPKTKQAKVTRGMILSAAKMLNIPTPEPDWLQTVRALNF
jgi:hypothetical protein